MVRCGVGSPVYHRETDHVGINQEDHDHVTHAACRSRSQDQSAM